MLIERYLQLVKTLYAEPKNEVILGSFFARLDAPPKQIAKNMNDPFPKKTPNNQPRHPDYVCSEKHNTEEENGKHVYCD